MGPARGNFFKLQVWSGPQIQNDTVGGRIKDFRPDDGHRRRLRTSEISIGIQE